MARRHELFSESYNRINVMSGQGSSLGLRHPTSVTITHTDRSKTHGEASRLSVPGPPNVHDNPFAEKITHAFRGNCVILPHVQGCGQLRRQADRSLVVISRALYRVCPRANVYNVESNIITSVKTSASSCENHWMTVQIDDQGTTCIDCCSQMQLQE